MLNLPTKVNPDKVNASLQDGILHITLPKAATAKANKVEVKAA
jgi:HSP20 family molecular chaperone IbpA